MGGGGEGGIPEGKGVNMFMPPMVGYRYFLESPIYVLDSFRRLHCTIM